MVDYDNERIETMLRQWESWISYYISGGRGTWPRDAFEALIEYYEEKLEQEKEERRIIMRNFCELTITDVLNMMWE